MSIKKSGTVSRVLSCAAIYLGTPSPGAQATYLKRCGQQHGFCLVLLRMGFTLTPCVTTRAVSSYLTISPLPLPHETYVSREPQKGVAVSFLLHFPWSHLRRTLSGILPYEARTFLVREISPATAYPTPRRRKLRLCSRLASSPLTYAPFRLLIPTKLAFRGGPLVETGDCPLSPFSIEPEVPAPLRCTACVGHHQRRSSFRYSGQSIPSDPWEP